MLCYSPLVNYHIVRLSLTPIYPPIYTSFVSSHLWTFLMQISFLENVTKTWDSFNPPPPLLVETKSWLFFQKFWIWISSKIVGPRRDKVTSVASIWLFSTVHFQMSPKIGSHRGWKITLAEFFYFSPLCVFKCLLKLPAWEDEKSHWLHLFDFSPLCVFKCVLKWPFWKKT